MVSVFVSMISAKPEPLEDPEPLEEFEPPRLPAVVPVPDPDELLDDEDEELLEVELPDPPDTASPGVRLESEAIVPLTGAYSLVLFTAVSALWTPACAEYTDAWAEATLPGDGVLVVVVVGVDVVAGRVVAGTVTVTVLVGAVVVVLPLVFEPPVPDPPVTG
jgi:hypothetical protein